MLKIGVLTSSRADYGIYQPLFVRLRDDVSVELHIICFGMHMLKNQGETFRRIENDNFGQLHKIQGMQEDDSAEGITISYARLIENFANFWKENSFDLVFTLGDRFEMSAAVQSTIPFEIRLAHIHAGETTKGAIDEIYRHQISLASEFHFTCTEEYSNRVRGLLPTASHVHNVGSLSLDGFKLEEIKNWAEVREEFNIPDKPFVLVTFHPETIGREKNSLYIKELRKFFTAFNNRIHFVVTMANSDTDGSQYRHLFNELNEEFPNSFSLIYTFGRDNYFSAMYHSKFLLGNTSSGIIEAASLGKYVINLGNRQEGRIQSQNIFNVPFKKSMIMQAVTEIEKEPVYSGENIYYKGNVAKTICSIVKNID